MIRTVVTGAPTLSDRGHFWDFSAPFCPDGSFAVQAELRQCPKWAL